MKGESFLLFRYCLMNFIFFFLKRIYSILEYNPSFAKWHAMTFKIMESSAVVVIKEGDSE